MRLLSLTQGVLSSDLTSSPQEEMLAAGPFGLGRIKGRNMNTNLRLFFGLMAMLASAAAAAVDCSTATTATPAALVAANTNPATGHYFEVYKADGIAWGSAEANAEGRTCGGVPGHLATLTSSAEDAWVDGLRQGAVGGSGLDLGEVWIGGFQPPSSPEPGGGWLWVNNEGPIPGDNKGPVYAHWAVGEPNDAGGAESHLALGRYGLGGGWNDEGAALNLIGGYIVEYDVPRAAACSGTSCQTIQGQTLIFPAGSIPPGATIKFNAYEFSDPRVVDGKCVGGGPLTLFGAAYGKPELRIPPYLCGSPKFVVVAVDSSQLDILQGTVFVENKTDVVLPGNLYQCNDPIVQNFPTQGDPQFQDVVVWQSTDPTRMLEDSRGAGQFAGAAGEFTNACGSSEAKIKGASYYVVGLHIDFGPGNEWASNAAGNHDSFVALTLYKLSLLQTAVANAKADGALGNGDATKMTAQLDDAVKKLGRGDASGALGAVNKFLKFVNAAQYTVVRYPPIPPQTVGTAKNYNGEHLMRGTNIEFMLRVKVIPYGP